METMNRVASTKLRLQLIMLVVTALWIGVPAGTLRAGEGDFDPYSESESYRSGGGGYRPDGLTNSLSEQSRAHQRELERLDSEQTQRARQEYQQQQQQQQQQQRQSNPYSGSGGSDNRGKDGR